MDALTPAQHGRQLASRYRITDEQAREFARILLSNDERIAA